MTTKLLKKLNATNLPQYVIAGYCGINPITLSQYARGKPILAHHLVALSRFFECEPDELVGDVSP